jgi:hypothetical protein
VSDTFKAALDAALQFHGSAQAGVDPEEIIGTAKRFYRELAVAAPSGVDAYNEDWYGQVYTWLRVLNGDQLGCVKDAVYQISAERNPPAAPPPQPPGPYAPVPQAPPVSEAWALLDKLNGPQPYPGTAAPIGPLVTRDELEQRLAEFGGDRNNAGDVEKAGRMQMNEVPLTQMTREERFPGEGGTDALLALCPGEQLRIREKGADPFTSTTVTTELQHNRTEGFVAFVPPGAFAEGRRDEIATESIDALLKALAPAKLSGTVLQQVKELVGTVSALRRRIQELETGRKTFETQLRVVLDADDEWETDDGYEPRQDTLDAAKRVVSWLEDARNRNQDLVWQLTEERAKGNVREFYRGLEPPETITVLKLIVPPTQKDAFGGYLMRLGSGWVRVQRKPEQMVPLDGSPWTAALPQTDSKARELTTEEQKAWEDGR